MSDTKSLLAHRNLIKRKKPNFLRQNAPRIKRLRLMWKKAKCDQSKVRLKKKGHRRSPSIGFSSPRAVRGLTRDGHSPLLIRSLADLSNAKTHILLSRTMGLRQRLVIIRKAVEKKLTIMNLKDPAAFLKGIEDSMKKKKDAAKVKEEIKEKAKAELARKEAAKKEVSPEDKAKLEKEEKKKVLEQK